MTPVTWTRPKHARPVLIRRAARAAARAAAYAAAAVLLPEVWAFTKVSSWA